MPAGFRVSCATFSAWLRSPYVGSYNPRFPRIRLAACFPQMPLLQSFRDSVGSYYKHAAPLGLISNFIVPKIAKGGEPPKHSPPPRSNSAGNTGQLFAGFGRNFSLNGSPGTAPSDFMILN